MENYEIIREFLDYLKFEKYFSQHTAKGYHADLKQFCRYINSRQDHCSYNLSGNEQSDSATVQPEIKIEQLLLSATPETIRTYMAALNDKQYSQSTIARKLATLRSFYKFLVKRGYISNNPVTAIRTPRQDKNLKNIIAIGTPEQDKNLKNKKDYYLVNSTMLKNKLLLKTKRIGARQIVSAFICLFMTCLLVYAGNVNLADEVTPLGTIVINAGESKIIRTQFPTVRVAVTNPKTVDVKVLTPYQLMLQGLEVGETDVIVWSKDEGDLQQWKVLVVMNISTYADKLKELFPKCSLEVSQSGGTLIVRGLLRSADQVRQLHDYLDKSEVTYIDMTSVAGTQQVQLDVKVAEVSRTIWRSFGVNALYTGENHFGGSRVGSSSGGALVPSIGIGPPEDTVIGTKAPTSYAINSDIVASSLVTIFAGIPRYNFEVFIQTLAENQYLKMLANPTLVALSGEESSFLAGGEFPIPVVQGGSGGSSISVEYREYGVRLNFRPIVLGDGTIRLFVAPEVSELTDVGVIIEGYSVPSLLTRKVETTLELKSGQTFAMAGLIKDDIESIRDRVPGLSNIPVLGTLFRSTRYKKKETELVVLVTVSLVEPISSSNVRPLPGFMHAEPNDWDFYIDGYTESQGPPNVHPEDAQKLKELGIDDLLGPGAWESYK
ncbi:MAG: site-specific integrase [Sedimentisphaerales bacterium]|nr:site-specific integrase [Sedimentisphaerales bacterium]